MSAIHVILCELGQVPLHLFWHKVLVQFVGLLVDLPNDRQVRRAFTQAQQPNTTCFQQLSGWLSDQDFLGILANGILSVSNAMIIKMIQLCDTQCVN